MKRTNKIKYEDFVTYLLLLKLFGETIIIGVFFKMANSSILFAILNLILLDKYFYLLNEYYKTKNAKTKNLIN